jgi:predicted transposase/invertase (TIGR01784 family)
MAKELIRFDWAMKRLLRNKANFEVLEGFLTELLKFDVIIDRIGESEGNQSEENDKYNRVDIFAHTTEGEIIIIELQVDSEMDYFHRMLYGVSKAIVEYMNLGDAYEKVKKVYSVNIVYFNLGQGDEYVYHGTVDFKGIHKGGTLQLTEKQKNTYERQYAGHIFPEYYILKVNHFDDVAKDGLDEWIYFLKNNEIKPDFKGKGLAKANETLKVNGMTEVEKRKYLYDMENESYKASMVLTAKFDGGWEAKEDLVIKSLTRGKLSAEEIAEEFGVSIPFVLRLKEENNL